MTEWKRDSGGNRFCDPHQRFHGPLYVCELYTAEQQAEVQAQSDQFRANLQDPAWLQQQRDNGVPDDVLAIYQVLAGVDGGGT